MNRRWTAIFLSITLLWYAATLASMVFGFSISMSVFDTGGDTPLLGTVLIALSKMLGFPVLLIGPKLGQLLPGLWGHIPFLLNSALWGALWTFGAHQFVKRRNAGKLLQ